MRDLVTSQQKREESRKNGNRNHNNQNENEDRNRDRAFPNDSSSSNSTSDFDVNSESRMFDKEKQREYEMYAFVLDQLGKLEERLLELLTAVEVEANHDNGLVSHGRRRGSWTLVPAKWTYGFGSGIAVAWVPVRGKALELVRMREALGPRVVFARLALLER